MSLDARLRRHIALDGPMTVAAYMAACLLDPVGGYYATRPRLGEGGDFITAPSVSQMFGELLGLWAGQVWLSLGRPSIRLVELGPGEGVLLSDALRAMRAVAGFADAAEVWLVEPSRPLKALQMARIDPDAAYWCDRLSDVSSGAPIILIANEVLDCLPAHQFVRTAQGWAERHVGLDEAGRLALGLSSAPTALPLDLDAAPPGAVLERSPAQEALGSEIGHRIAHDGGAAILIDYGRERFGFGDTLQAVRAHTKIDVLQAPGEADLTVHADFPAVAAAARAAGAKASVIVTQGEFLQKLGIVARAGALAAAHPALADRIGRQLRRLIHPDEMGTLFKVLVIHQDGFTPPGFEA